MAETMSDDERLAEAWLKSRGYKPEFTPKIVVQGRSPDFLACGVTAPTSLWAEMKTLEPEEHSKVLARVWSVMHEKSLPPGLHGHATLWLDDSTRDQSVRQVLKLFREYAPKYKNENVRLVFIQQNPDTGGTHSLSGNDGITPMHFWVRGAGSAMFALPPGVMEDGSGIVTVNEIGASYFTEAYKVFDWNAPLNCALVATLDSSQAPLSICPLSGGGVTVAQRVFSTVTSANGQIRNACRYLSAPGIVLITTPPYGHVDNAQIAAGIYGRLMFPIEVSSGRAGPLQHGPDAVFQSQKNRHVSAVIRLNRDGTAGMYFPNAFAHNPIDKQSQVLSGLECYPAAKA